MSLVNDSKNLRTLMSYRGVDVIGSTQRTIAFTVVASGGTGLINITAAAHGLKKGQSFRIASGAYAGIYQVKKVISTSIIQTEATFGATSSGNIQLDAAINGEGFIVSSDGAALVIASIVPFDANTDPVPIIQADYAIGQEVAIPFKSIQITTGTVTVVRKQPRAALSFRS